MCLEVVMKSSEVCLKVSERCLGGVWMVSGRCPESGRCRIGLWSLPKGDLEGVCKVSKRCLEALGQNQNFLVQTFS